MSEGLAALGIEPKRTSRARKLVIAGLIASFVTAAVVFVVRGHDGGAPAYVTDRVTRGDLVASVTAVGSLRPMRTVDVSAEISGRVRAVHVDVNDTVTVGQPLIELDTDSLSATAQQGRAAVHESAAAAELARANEEEARRTLARTESMHARGLVTDRDLEAAQTMHARTRAEIAVADARTRRAQAALRESSTGLSRAVIRSPIDGVVLVRVVQPGQTVAAMLQAPMLLQLAEDLRKMALHVDVDEADVGRVRPGLEATFVVDAYPGRTFRGEITRVAYAGRLVQNVVSYETVLTVDNPDLALRPAMTANATIITETRRGVLRVPSAALRFSPRAQLGSRDRRWDAPRGPTIWTLRGETLVPVSVRVRASDETHVEVEGRALREGMVVVLDTRSEDAGR